MTLTTKGGARISPNTLFPADRFSQVTVGKHTFTYQRQTGVGAQGKNKGSIVASEFEVYHLIELPREALEPGSYESKTLRAVKDVARARHFEKIMPLDNSGEAYRHEKESVTMKAYQLNPITKKPLFSNAKRTSTGVVIGFERSPVPAIYEFDKLPASFRGDARICSYVDSNADVLTHTLHRKGFGDVISSTNNTIFRVMGGEMIGAVLRTGFVAPFEVEAGLEQIQKRLSFAVAELEGIARSFMKGVSERLGQEIKARADITVIVPQDSMTSFERIQIGA